MLEPHRDALEKCVYCPKLSRAACPVSNVEKNETVTPWGKMSMAYFAGRGDVPLDAVHAEPAWACSACFACRERCDHKNEVGTVLADARAALFAAGVAPEAARRTAAAFAARAEENARAALALGASSNAGAVPVLIGCGYVRHAPEVATDALEATATLLGRPVRPIRACCGLPLLYAGDRPGFLAAGDALRAEIAGAPGIVAVDPGCARAVQVEHPRTGSKPFPGVALFLDLAARGVDRLRPSSGPVRFHDPCQLGRGLGRYDEPRAVLRRITGEDPARFLREREHGECSGGGGLLPVTRPATSRAVADERIAEHRAAGGGLLVTHCAQSLRRFRSRGEPAADLVTLVARALRG
jgi:dimethylglycine catabolism B